MDTVHVFFQIHVNELKHQIKSAIAVDHIVQPERMSQSYVRSGKFKNLLDNIWMSQLPQSGDLSESCAWDSLIFIFEFHLFHRNDEVRLSVSCFINHTIGSFATVAILF
jgi:hypothetical protein